MSYECILVGYDGSSASKKAVIRALRLARLSSAKLVVVTVIPPIQFLLGEMLTPIPIDTGSLIENSRESLERLVKELREVNEYPAIEYDILEGDPAETLADYAKEKNCDLIVVGRRGMGRVERALLGSVSSRLVSLAQGVDVLVVEPGR